jgi:RNA polymerase sigma-70 factor (ECF subfamily)
MDDVPGTHGSPELAASSGADPVTAQGPGEQAARERRTFERVHAEHRALVHGVVLAMVGPARTEDLVQTVFLKALKAWREQGPAENPGAWLRTIARNAARDALRGRPRERQLDDETAATPSPRIEAREILEQVLALPDAYREPLILRLVEGMTGPEIAARTGLTPGSVRVNLCRGMKLLRARLQGEESDA